MAIDQQKIRKTIRKLHQSLDSKSQWRSPEKVHDLRTRSRRLEVVMRALMLDQEQSGRRLLKSVTRIFSQAGKVRDMDVLTAFASGLDIDGHGAHHDPHRDACLAQLLDHLHQERQKSALKLHARIAKHGKPVRQYLKEYSSRLRSNSEARDVQRLQSNATAFASQLWSELVAWPRLTVANMHSYRLKVKALRYTLQMAESDDSPFISMLEKITDAIGEWHDWNKLSKVASKMLRRHSNCPVSKAIRSAASAKCHQALLLANTIRKKHLASGPHASHTLSEPVFAAIATLENPSSKPRIS